MKFWLMKAEPDSRVVKGKDVKFSVDDFEKIQITPWEGVRNHSAKLNMKSMEVGDKVLFYHSNCKMPGVAAIATVHKEAHPDYTAWDSTHPYFDAKSDEAKPTWFMVDLKFKSRVAHFVSLSLLKHLKSLSYEDIQAIDKVEEGSSTPLQVQYLSGDELSAIKEMPLLTQGRLSVQPVSELAFQAVLKLGEMGGWEEVAIQKKAAPKTEKPKGGRKGAKRKAADVGTDAEDAEEDSSQPEPVPSRAKKARQKEQVPDTTKPTRQSMRKKT
ncbi:hypothetical protein M407DRAFT_79658 [Tulasnella calospora MUT 4182]|uniref:EVE domain-containing protein n=1 Tax=Tulasnella calospora MUT 4182 TaxID=1051891 RepID=A0A0C3KKS3_9AGAM|nr:hypothetical protein M407DRAFT_79658 [Tulasnella calospora MUT 4182]